MECARQGVVPDMTRALTDLQTEWDAWHSAREAELATPHGWLSLRSLQWLTPEPSPVEGVPGLWSATPDGVVITAAPADELVVRSVREPRRVDGTVTLHPVDGKPGTLIEHGDLVIEVVRRTDAHALRLRDPAAATRTAFTGVPAFPVDERWVVDAVFQPYVEPRRITVGAVVEGLSHFPTAVGDVIVPRRRAGAAPRRPRRAGRRAVAALPRRDLRREHLRGRPDPQDRRPGPDGELTLDLNRVVNLPCAFTEFATCPLPPAGNTLTVAVEAGEQAAAPGPHTAAIVDRLRSRRRRTSRPSGSGSPPCPPRCRAAPRPCCARWPARWGRAPARSA